MKWDVANVGHHVRDVQALLQTPLHTPWGAVMAGALLVAFAAVGGAGPAAGADYAPVTDARLANPEPANWLMTRGNYKGWSYSALDRINSPVAASSAIT